MVLMHCPCNLPRWTSKVNGSFHINQVIHWQHWPAIWCHTTLNILTFKYKPRSLRWKKESRWVLHSASIPPVAQADTPQGPAELNWTPSCSSLRPDGLSCSIWCNPPQRCIFTLGVGFPMATPEVNIFLRLAELWKLKKATTRRCDDAKISFQLDWLIITTKS